MNLLYIFNFGESDVGPKKHASEVVRNTRHNIKYISNIQLDLTENCLAVVDPKSSSNVFVNIQLFQILCFWHIIKKRSDFDVVIVRQSVGFFVLNFLLKMFQFKVVTEANGLLYQDVIDRGRGKWTQRFIRTLERWNLLFSDVIVAVHDNIKQSLSSFYGEVVAKKIVVVENGVDLELPSFPHESSKLTIGYLGSFAHREGVDFLPQVSSSLAARNIDHEFLLVGGTSEEIECVRSTLSEQQKATFRFVGYVEYKRAKELLKSCHLFIHLRRPIQGVTDSQGCPLKTLDYLSVGRCVVATRIQSYTFLEQENLGVLVPFTEEDFGSHVADCIASRTQEDFSLFYNRGQVHLQNKTWKKQIAILDELCDDLLPENVKK
ncbi:glycosyltransferase [Vibrio sp. 404]|uniref:Glycosyltransferase n=1 Tax=Vibrio marinisediminis TaxID=2758441 RepID=A0A7W2FR81_9VIBR|nr:glycosyltransferase [Vibrio marinisediminis]MBA5762795.1 glycosyltransferase [Vibrio marinisediminis]